MSFTRFVYVMGLEWQGVIWGCVTIIAVIAFYTFLIYSAAWLQGRIAFVKNMLPELHGGIVKELQQDKKSLVIENKRLTHLVEDYQAKLNVIKKSVE